MIENKDNELLRQFSAQHTFELANGGLAQQVTQKLSRRSVSLNRIWVVFYCLLGVIFLLVSNALNQLRMAFNNLVSGISGWTTSIELDI